MVDSSNVMSNSGRNKNFTDFSKEELNAILQFGTEDLFKKSDSSAAAAAMDVSQGAEFDLDQILAEAEQSAKSEQEQEEESSSNDLFAAFQSFEPIAFAGGESGEARDAGGDDVAKTENAENIWRSILPQDEVDKIAAEELQAQEEKMALSLQPRQRRAATLPSLAQTSAAIAGASTASSASNKRKLTARLVAQQLKKTGNDAARITAALGLPAHRKKEVAAMCEKILETCRSEVAKAGEPKEQEEKDADKEEEEGDEKKKKKAEKGPKVEGVDCAEILRRCDEMAALQQLVLRYGKSHSAVRLANAPPLPKGWGVSSWNVEADGLLLFACAEHGVGNWDAWREDPRLAPLMARISSSERVRKPKAEEQGEGETAAPATEAEPPTSASDDGLLSRDKVMRRIDTLLKRVLDNTRGKVAATKKHDDVHSAKDKEDAKHDTKKEKAEETKKEGKATTKKEDSAKARTAAKAEKGKAEAVDDRLENQWPDSIRPLFVHDVRRCVCALRNVGQLSKEQQKEAILTCGRAVTEYAAKHKSVEESSLWAAIVKESKLKADAARLKDMYEKMSQKLGKDKETAAPPSDRKREREREPELPTPSPAKRPRVEDDRKDRDRDRGSYAERRDRDRDRDRDRSRERDRDRDRDSHRERDRERDRDRDRPRERDRDRDRERERDRDRRGDFGNSGFIPYDQYYSGPADRDRDRRDRDRDDRDFGRDRSKTQDRRLTPDLRR
jgi:hypothetical protein